jgi:ankyrin repeat protein
MLYKILKISSGSFPSKVMILKAILGVRSRIDYSLCDQSTVFGNVCLATPIPSRSSLKLWISASKMDLEDLNRMLRNSAQEGKLNEETLRGLLNSRANINSINTAGHNALMLAANGVDHNHVMALSALIAAGAHLEGCSFAGNTPVCIAASRGNEKGLAALIEAGAQVDVLGSVRTLLVRLCVYVYIYVGITCRFPHLTPFPSLSLSLSLSLFHFHFLLSAGENFCY